MYYHAHAHKSTHAEWKWPTFWILTTPNTLRIHSHSSWLLDHFSLSLPVSPYSSQDIFMRWNKLGRQADRQVELVVSQPLLKSERVRKSAVVGETIFFRPLPMWKLGSGPPSLLSNGRPLWLDSRSRVSAHLTFWLEVLQASINIIVKSAKGGGGKFYFNHLSIGVHSPYRNCWMFCDLLCSWITDEKTS